MIRRITIFLFFIILPATAGLSQHISHQVLVPAAGLASASGVSYSQTVGETAVEIERTSGYILTEGFQQPGMKFINDTEPEGTGVKVYPNPFFDEITIELFGETGMAFKIEIANITGKVVFSEMKVFYDKFWYREPQNVSGLIRGFYIVRVTCENPMMNRTFKIEKI